jgi:hypothetical protein
MEVGTASAQAQSVSISFVAKSPAALIEGRSAEQAQSCSVAWLECPQMILAEELTSELKLTILLLAPNWL